MKILLICSAGMSTSLLVQNMRKAAIAENITATIDAAGSEGLEDIIPNYDVMLVGPQVRHRFKRFEEIAKSNNKPIDLIPPQIYGLVDGKKALEYAKQLLATN